MALRPWECIELLVFFNDTATTEIYTLSLHDALPIFDAGERTPFPPYNSMGETIQGWLQAVGIRTRVRTMERTRVRMRSEEHTSELQSHLNLVCRLLLEKKKKR